MLIIDKKKRAEMLQAAEPLMKWLNDNCHPHCNIIVKSDSVELVEEVCRMTSYKFIK